MKTIHDYNFQNKKACVRVDFNVPLNDSFEITDDSRITKAIPTLRKILDDGGSIILMSHLGRPKGEAQDKFSLKHVQRRIAELLERPIQFASNCIGEEASKMASNLQKGEVLLLENLRFHKEETSGDTNFAKKLASYGNIYVNDAFGTAHRAHSSTAVIAQFFEAKCFGNIMASELNNAQKIANNPARPMTAIVGGAKVSDKILIIDNLIEFADNIIVGGGMAYTFMKAQGGKIGNSLCEDERMALTLEIIQKAKNKGVNLLLPEDSVVADNFAADANTAVSNSNDIEDGWMGLDIGPKASEKYKEVLSQSKTILWNGPMGVFEMPAFEKGTKAVADAVAQSTTNGAFSLIGGGDSAAAVKQFNYLDKVSYVSTGGGALLKYFEGKILPGVKAIED